jgi:N-acetylneuraminic acid mutarotase
MTTHSGMARRLRLALLAVASVLALVLTPAAGALAAPAAPVPQVTGGTPSGGATGTSATGPANASLPSNQKQVCGQQVKPGYAECAAIVRTDVKGTTGLVRPNAASAATAPAGYGPADLQSAYNLPSATAGAGATVAVVDAYNDPAAEADLAVYRQQYGLPACTTANGCFRKVTQDGGTTKYPAQNNEWDGEISLDLDTVSATCPLCHILLVEANDNSVANLGAAVNEAVALGAKYVSNSYGGSETLSQTQWDKAYFDHPGVAITAASGDLHYGLGYPAASPYVTAVGGTTLTRDAKAARGWDETEWLNSGSGCSSFESKPAWQTDTGCQNRTVADVSADADPNTGVAVYDSIPGVTGTSGWSELGGTSLSAPLIAAVYALAGTPFAGSNPASYPYANPSALNDITTWDTYYQAPSCTPDPAYLCDPGTGYDGPTGLGTPNGTAAFTLPHGDIAGTVTDASTGKPLAGAIVKAGTASATTGPDGTYDIPVPAGSYDISAVDVSGYATGVSKGVQVTAGQSASGNFALTPAPNVTVSGTVTDGGGQGWPLYAKVSADGLPLSTHTDPVTGHYSLSVPQGTILTLKADPVYPGYQPATQSVTVGTTGATQDISAKLDPYSCTAPGYQYGSPVLSEGFDGSSTPSGWSVVTNGDKGDTWRFDNPGGLTNDIGSGNFAIAYDDPQFTAPGPPMANTELVSPVMDLSGQAYPVLQFDTGWNYTGSEKEVELSLDGGQTWSMVWFQASQYFSGPPHMVVPLPQAAGHSDVQVRFHYINDNFEPGVHTFQVLDNVTVSGCDPASGGLVVGKVSDANTGNGVNGATVASADAATESGTTQATPDDTAAGDGLYWLFSTLSGSHPFTATASRYTPKTSSVTVTRGKLTRADFTLDAGQLATAPASVSGTAQVGGSTSGTVTVTNTGTAPATYTFSTQPGGFTLAGQPAAAARPSAVPVQRVRGSFTPKAIAPKAAGGAKATPGAVTPSAASPKAGSPAAGVQPAAAGPAGAQWAPVATYPTAISGANVATDPVTGKVYSVGGETDEPAIVSSGYVLDPATGLWTALPAAPHTRSDGVAAFIGGKVYVTSGVNEQLLGVPSTDIYDPATGRWSIGAAIPEPYYGAGSAVLGGKMYVVGGCDPGYNICNYNNVQVYNPAANAWTTAAPYPASVGFLSCGAIGGKLYCAGGVSDVSGTTTAAYSYNPATNSWSPIASLPIDLWASASSSADGQLLLSGGVTANETVVTNQGFAYDPSANAWTALPNAPLATYHASAACGFYQIGGTYAPSNLVGSAVPNVYQLPGYGDCGGDPWVTASPASANLQPGQSVQVKVSLDASSPAITQPGTYSAALRIDTDTPYPATTVPVTLTASAPRTWGEITGTVTGTSCAGATAPVPDATVQVTGAHGSWLLTTDANGQFALWLDTKNNPLTEIVSGSGWKSQAAAVSARAGATTTHNFTLSPSISCA